MTAGGRRSNGEGTIRYDKKRGRTVYSKRRTREDDRPAVTMPGRREISEITKVWESKYGPEKPPDSRDTPFCEVAEEWLETKRPSLKPGTFDMYASMVKAQLIPRFQEKSIGEITEAVAQHFINDLVAEYAGHTVNIIKTTLVQIMKFARRRGYVSENPVQDLQPVREVRKERKTYSDEQVRHLLEVAREGEYMGQTTPDEVLARHGFYVFILLLTVTGMRRGECAALRWQDWDKDSCTLQIGHNLSRKRVLDSPKTVASIRAILIDQETAAVLNAWHEEQRAYGRQYGDLFDNQNDMMFTNLAGKPVSLDNLRLRYWKKLVSKSGLPDYGMHSLRHYHATLLARNKVPIKVAQQRLGHAKITTTLEIYTHVQTAEQEAAVAAVSALKLT